MDDERLDEIDTEESENDDDEDGGILFQKATITKQSTSGGGPPLAPPSNLIWQEGAIVECFELAVQSHDKSNYSRSWKAMPLFAPKEDDPPENDGNNLADWEPQPLQLPLWAVATIESEKNRKATVEKEKEETSTS